SSSGSASAVAQGLCDVALGTDTGGSVRVPASFCGLYGIRPTHGRLDLTGMMAQAPSSHTTGWFARDAKTFARVSEVLLGEPIPESERQWAAMMRAEACARLAWLLPPGTILCMPTTPFPAPPKGLPLATLEPLRARIGCLASQGGLTGVPQVSLPGAAVDGLPVGLSILGARGSDTVLVAVAKAMEAGR